MSNPPSNWTRTAVTGRIRVISSNLGAGQYICRNVGARNNLKTCDEYEDALKVRIAPAEDTVILECPNANASGMHWLGLAASSDGEFGKNSSEWVALTFTTIPSVYPPLKTADNTTGPVSWAWQLGWDGSLRTVWNDAANQVGYGLSWSVELSTKRVYGVSCRKAYLSRYYPNGNGETPVRLVFEPDTIGK